jgi:hypothetical protein
VVVVVWHLVENVWFFDVPVCFGTSFGLSMQNLSKAIHRIVYHENEAEHSENQAL